MNKIDPVCGTDVSAFGSIIKASHKGESFYFCCEKCKDKFNKNPDKFRGDPLIKLSNIKKSFSLGERNTKVLRGLDINIWPGDFITIIGSSGSGKSTVLNLIGLLDRPTSGKIFLNGKDTASLDDEERAVLRSETFGFVFQQYNLIPWLTAYENVTLPLILAKKDVDEGEFKKQFEEIGLGDRMVHRPFELSGGEQQRTALLRALANNPKIILGDEPTGNLDSATGNKILEILIDLNKTHKKTLIIVTHDADIAEKADHIITLKDGQVVNDHKTHKKIYTE